MKSILIHCLAMYYVFGPPFHNAKFFVSKALHFY
jgi:hypothetical protein